MIFFGSFLAVSSVSFASQEFAVNKNSSTLVQAKKREKNSIFDDIVKNLIDRGIEESETNSFLEHYTKVDEEALRVFMKMLEEDVSYNELVEVLADRVLYKKSLDFTNFDTLVSISHELKGYNLSKEFHESLHKITKISDLKFAA